MATRYWLGSAVAIPEVKTYLFAGTWLATETAYIEINGKRLTLTLTSGDTMTTVAVCAAFIDMINGAAANENEKRSALGDAVGEFAGLTAAVGATTSTLKITGADSGRPIGTVTVGETSTSGTFAAIGGGDDVTGTGPNFYSDADNWSGNAVPVAADDIVFDQQAASSCLYGLDQSAVTPTSVTVTSGFRYAIGLPAVNTDASNYPYDEHQVTYLTLLGGGTVVIDASGAQMVKLNVANVSTAITINGTGTTSERNTPALLLKSNHASSTITVTAGSVGLNYEPKVTGIVATANVGGLQAASLEIGDSTTVTTILQTSGTVICRSAVTTVTIGGGSFYQYGGAITTVTIDAGTLYLHGTGTLTTVNLGAGVLDASQDARSRTITNMNVYARAQIKDPSGTITFTNGLDVYCKLDEVTLDLPARRTYAISAI